GIVPAGKPSIHAVGWLPSLEPAQRGALVLDAIGRVAAVHAVDWRRTHGFLRGDRPHEPGLARHLAETLEWYRWTARGREFAVVDAAMAYVLEHADAVDQGDPVLLWGDARAGNTMFDPRTHTVSALLDWENSCLGPAGVDLAHWLVFDEFATTATGVERLPGYPGHDEIVAAYEQAAGRRIPDLDYFEILQCLFVAITLIRQADRAVAAGRLRPESRMGHDNVLTQMLARRLGLPVPELDPDYLLHRRPVPPGG
ncbi:MAG: phosphotransferase, partial [Frankiales bacterium]|nr:phosphotransferase [Frankiales bacterium]